MNTHNPALAPQPIIKSYTEPPMPGAGYWYLAGPYSDDPEGRYGEHIRALACLIKAGIHVYSPIAHCHSVAARYGLPKDAAFWSDYNCAMIMPSNGLIVLLLPNWEKSKGTVDEIRYCKECGMPVWSLEPPNADALFRWSRLA